jgi:hypothetical protein
VGFIKNSVACGKIDKIQYDLFLGPLSKSHHFCEGFFEQNIFWSIRVGFQHVPEAIIRP